MSKPNIRQGIIVGVMLALALIALFYVGQQVAGFPFVPYNLFDWIARTLPGGVVTFGIDLIVELIRGFNLGPTDTTAKLAEQIMALGLFFLLTTAAVTIFFAVMRSDHREILSGLILGLTLGIPMLLIVQMVDTTSTAEPSTGYVWTVGLFMAWGLAANWIYGTLAFGVRETQAASGTTPASVEPIDRRQFLLQVGAASALITVAGAGVSALLMTRTRPAEAVAVASAPVDPGTLPNSGDPVTPAPGTRPELTPLADHYRIDINLSPPVIEEEGYTLPFTYTDANGSTSNVAELTLEQIRNDYEAVDVFVTMGCISNRIAGDLISTTRWTGVPMQRLLAQMEVPADATHLRMVSVDGFDETVPLADIAADERIMLTYAWDGQPLLVKHGFPLRIHIPNRYGMKQPKWITQMEFIRGDVDGYWVRRGWDKEAFVRATAVIDTVAVDELVRDEQGVRVPIGGIAWAGDRGISAVQLRVDDGPWQEAQLRAPLSDRAWTVWRFDWPYLEGAHTFSVRCVEGDGTAQLEENNPVRPSGATGIHSLRETLRELPA